MQGEVVVREDEEDSSGGGVEGCFRGMVRGGGAREKE